MGDPVVRYNNAWHKIVAKPYEPERQTNEVVWSMLREPLLKSPDAYRQWNSEEKRKASILYPSFRKEKNGE